jgi:hypothetical protein
LFAYASRWESAGLLTKIAREGGFLKRWWDSRSSPDRVLGDETVKLAELRHESKSSPPRSEAVDDEKAGI